MFFSEYSYVLHTATNFQIQFAQPAVGGREGGRVVSEVHVLLFQ